MKIEMRLEIMPEYIEREALLDKVIKENRFVFRTDDLLNNKIIYETVYNDFAKVLYSIPTADVVEVVRCKYCINYNKRHSLCTLSSIHLNENGFCSYGKRKEV